MRITYLATVARLAKEKGYLELFAAVTTVLRRYPPTTFVVVGGIHEEK